MIVGQPAALNGVQYNLALLGQSHAAADVGDQWMLPAVDPYYQMMHYCLYNQNLLGVSHTPQGAGEGDAGVDGTPPPPPPLKVGFALACGP